MTGTCSISLCVFECFAGVFTIHLYVKCLPELSTSTLYFKSLLRHIKGNIQLSRLNNTVKVAILVSYNELGII